MADESVLFTIMADPAAAEEAFANLDAMLTEFAAQTEEVGAQIDAAATQIDASLATIGEAAAGAADAAGASMEALAASSDAAAAGLDATAASAGAAAGALDAASASAKGAAASSEEAAAAGSAWSDTMGGLKLQPLLLAGAATVAAAGAFVKMGADGEDALTRVQALTGATDAQMEQYSSSLDQMAGKYGKTVTDLSGGLYDVVSVGFQGADALNTLKVASEAAAAGGVDLHTVTGGLTSIMKAFGVDGAHASDVMDTLLLGVRDGKASFEDYANAIGLVAVQAKGSGFSLKESAAALSTLTAVFPNARRAGMDLQNLMKFLGTEAEATGNKAKKMGLGFDQAKFNSLDLQGRLEYLQQITHGNQAEMLSLTGGAAGYAAAQVLLGNKSADFTRNLKDQKNATGATKKAFEEWSNSTGQHAADMTGSLSALAQQFVVLTGPLIKDGLDKLTGLFQGLSTFMQQHSEATKAGLVLLAGVIGGALVFALTAGAIAAWGFLAPILIMAAPFIAVGLAIAAVALAIKYAYDHWTPFRQAVDGAKAALSEFGKEIEARAGPAIANIQKAIQAAMPIIQAIWNVVWPQLKDAFVMVWGIMSGYIKVVWSLISGIIKIGLDLLGGNWKQAWLDMQEMFKGVWDGIQQMLGSAMKGIAKGVLDGLRPMLQALSNIPGPIGDMAKKALGSIDALEKGIDGDTKKAAQAAERNSATMRAGVAGQTLQMQQQSLSHLEAMRKGIEDKMSKAKTAAQKNALEMQLAVVNNQIDTRKQAIDEAQQMNVGVSNHMKQMHDKVTQHAQNTKSDMGSAMTGLKEATSKSGQDMQTNFAGSMTLLHDNAKTKSQSTSDSIGAVMGGLGASAATWGADMVIGFITGLSSKIPALAGAVGGLASTIAKALHFSVPDEGPLADADKWMPDMGELLARGMQEQTSRLKAQAQLMAGAINEGVSGGLGATSGALAGVTGAPSLGALPPSSALAGSGVGGFGGGNGAVLALLAQIAQGVSRQQPLGAVPTPANLGAITQNLGGVTMNGVSDINALYQQLNLLAGVAIENGARGATAGLGL